MGLLSDLFGPKDPAEIERRRAAKAESRIPPYLRDREFTAPGTPAEVMAVILTTSHTFTDDQLWSRLKERYDREIEAGEDPSAAPLAEAIWLSRLSRDGMTVTAGNRANTRWTLNLSFEGANPTTGRITVDVPSGDLYNVAWHFQLTGLIIDVEWAFESMGGKKLRWPWHSANGEVTGV